MITTTFKKLHEGGACKNRYKHLAEALGGINKYGRTKPITPLQILNANGFVDALESLQYSSIDADGRRLLRLFACDCAERSLLRERKAGREPSKPSWDAIATSRRYTNGKATYEELTAARNAAKAVANNLPTAAWHIAWHAVCTTFNLACRAASGVSYHAIDTIDGELEWQTNHLRKMLESE